MNYSVNLVTNDLSNILEFNDKINLLVLCFQTRQVIVFASKFTLQKKYCKLFKQPNVKFPNNFFINLASTLHAIVRWSGKMFYNSDLHIFQRFHLVAFRNANPVRH